MLCPKCGTEAEGMKFCPNCGTPLHTGSDDADQNRSRNIEFVDFRVHRMEQNNTSAVPISIFVDGYLYGTVNNGAASEFQITEGFHIITLRLANKTVSKPINVSKVSDCYIGVSGKPGSPVFFDDIPENYEEECRKKEAAEKRKLIRRGRRECNKWVSLILCLFFGVTGTHNFYEGKVILGVFRLLGVSSAVVLAFFGPKDISSFFWIALAVFIVEWIVDFFVILFKDDPYFVVPDKRTVPVSLILIFLCASLAISMIYSRAGRTVTVWDNMIGNTSVAETTEETPNPDEPKQYEFIYEKKEPIKSKKYKINLEDGGFVNIIEKGEIVQTYLGPSINFLVENNTSHEISIRADECSVNGYMVGHMMSCEIVPDKKINGFMVLSQADIDKAGINKIENIEFRLIFTDYENMETLYKTDFIRIDIP